MIVLIMLIKKVVAMKWFDSAFQFLKANRVTTLSDRLWNKHDLYSIDDWLSKRETLLLQQQNENEKQIASQIDQQVELIFAEAKRNVQHALKLVKDNDDEKSTILLKILLRHVNTKTIQQLLPFQVHRHSCSLPSEEETEIFERVKPCVKDLLLNLKFRGCPIQGSQSVHVPHWNAAARRNAISRWHGFTELCLTVIGFVDHVCRIAVLTFRKYILKSLNHGQNRRPMKKPPRENASFSA
jgi:hypothetical protein